MKVIDNFLPDYFFKSLRKELLTANFPWYYNDNIVCEDDGLYQFTHTFYDIRENRNPSVHFSLFELATQKLGVKKLLRIKGNLNPRTVFNRKTGWHTDLEMMGPHQTAVYYINTNNGWTKFKKGGKVKSVANRMVIFDSNLEHQGVTCTDEKRRVVINFNYEV